jgi:hypothetical protein
MHDTGFAPCIQDDILTLTCCKPKIRTSARKGDYLVAFYGKCHGELGHALAYIARIDKVMDFKKYHEEHSGRIDCIYDGKLRQLKNKFHGKGHRKIDLGGKNALICSDFIFFGDKNMDINLKYLGMIAGRGHKVKYNDRFKKSFPKYFAKLKKKHGSGKLGEHIEGSCKPQKRKLEHKCKPPEKNVKT